MGSFKSNGRNQGPDRRRDERSKRLGFPKVETLEGRLLLDGNPVWRPATTDLADVKNGPMANEGPQLIQVYQAFTHNGGDASNFATRFPLLQFKGNSVAVSVKGNGDFNALLTSLKNLGMQVTASSSTYAIAEGYLPIAQLPSVAALPQTVSAGPIFKPKTNYQGVANNQGDQSLNADVLRNQTGLDGTGVTVGVLSDSFNQFQGGYADSVRTGDLPQGVRNLADFPGGEDEGRAMLEQIYDIAPKAGLAFATGFTGQLAFGNNIRALQSQAGAGVIVDDISYLNDPMFQDGLIQQGVNDVVAKGVAYFSSAANQAPNNGYLAPFKGVDTTVTGVGAGHFMNFNFGNGSANALLPVTVNAPVVVGFQYDQPYFTQQPAGSTNRVTSDVDIFVLDASGNVVASGTSNNLATQEPFEALQIPSAGNYFIAIQVKSGTDPGNIEFTRFSNGPDNTFLPSTNLGGSAQGVYYPSSMGHNAGPNTIGVGAVPWWATTPFLGTNPLNSEGFSSSGPAFSVRNPDGSLKSQKQVVLNPAVTGPDGVNTSFFIPGFIIDTSNPPFPGQPATPTNLSQNLPSFFGTSSAAPNLAAVAALLKQRVPTATPDQIRSAMIASARPMNGSTQGVWNAQAGYGLVDAVAALSAIDVLRVASTTPADLATVTTTPNQIVVTFNKKVDMTTVSKANLQFQSVPSSITGLLLGTPVGVDDPKFPTTVAFPFSFQVAANQLGNGKFAYKIAGNIKSQDGKLLTPYSASFNINDTVAPQVTNTTVNGRVVTATFSEPMSASSITKASVFVYRDNGNGTFFNLNNDPRSVLTYNAATNTVTLDYSGLSQAQLGAGKYYLRILGGSVPGDPAVTDVVGNKLNGQFTGVFPSGDPSGLTKNSDFVQLIGNIQSLTAPVITSLELLPQYDTGIKGDSNTSVNQPVFLGQVTASFPGTVSGLTVYAQFNAYHGGNLDLQPLNGRGYQGSYDVQVTTDANGSFRLPTPFLPEGFQRIRLVVIGQPDTPPEAGLSSQFDKAFRVDNTAPQVTGASLTPGAATLPLGSATTPLNTLNTLSLNVVDNSNPIIPPFSTPAQILYPAADPSTAANISNYSLINTDLPAGSNDFSRFIATAKFVSTDSSFVNGPNRTLASDPYYGRIDLTFSPGLTKGRYQFIVHTNEKVGTVTYAGLTDAAGNALDDTTVPGQGTKNFVLNLNIQPEPVYVVSVSSDVTNAQNNTLVPRSYYEINPRAGDLVSAPPTAFNVDFSNPLDPGKSYANALQIIATANAAGATPDGDFGNLGVAGLGSSGSGFTRINPAGTTVTLTDGKYGPNTRLVLQLPAGFVLPADHYRLYMPNAGTSVIQDIYGNVLDGEFLGNPEKPGNSTANPTATDLNGNPQYENLLPTGQYREGMSGDGVAGGAFTTGFVVVPTGNIVYARPDYVEDPLLPSTTPDGSLSKPYPVLAPQAAPNSLNSATLNNGDPNGGLNSSVNFLSGFNPVYDRAGLGKFARSAFYAAQQLSTRGPVVIVALPGTPQRDPVSGVVSQKTFVLQAPAGSDSTVNDGSASVPFDTTLVFNPGSTLKLLNATLFVQNQGSGVQALGGPNPNDTVNFTSYADDSVAGDTNGDGSNSTARGGDWGGIVFRNFDSTVARQQAVGFPVDGTPTGPNGLPAVSGADDALSTLNYASVKYAGGAVPATRGTRYDAVMLFNSRPSITNSSIRLTGGSSSSQAAISGDMDSFREDDLARGLLVRRTTVSQNSLNGIWVRPNLNGVVQQTDAIAYPDNPVTLGGVRNYTFDDPLPYIFTSRMEIGIQLLQGTPNQATTSVLNRVYIQPGMMFKFQRGGGIEEITPGSSLIIGDRTYIAGFDAKATIDPVTGLPTSTYSPLDANFKANSVGDARVLFTSLYDNTATTSYFDPITQQVTQIVPAIDSANTGPNNPYQPTPGNVPALARWGSVSIYSGAIANIDESEMRYGGGTLNIAGGTTSRNILTMYGSAGGTRFIPGQGFVTTAGLGSRSIITNNNFFDNVDAPIYADPDIFLATSAITPLSSGHPFFRGNFMQRNDVNGVAVGGIGGLPTNASNLSNDSVWDQTDITYVVRGTIIPRGNFGFGGGTTPPTTLGPQTKPSLTLTIQAALPDTLLANGQRIPRPGESVIVKLQGAGPGDGVNGSTNADNGGAGFLFGVDDGIDPPADPTIDQGNNTQLRILGIGGNETTGQQRVPAIITSIYDTTVGPTVRGVPMTTVLATGNRAPQPGDGGLIYFGGNSLTTYNALDMREGNKIDNADIRYVTRIEMQGGGNIDFIDLNASGSFDAGDDPDSQLRGVFPNLANGQPDPRNILIQRNTSKELTISNSNLTNFRDVGVLVHPGFDIIAGGARAGGIRGEPAQLMMYNNTISNMPTGVRMRGETVDNPNFPNPYELLLLNNTFYNNPIGVDIISVNFNGNNSRSHVHFVGMDNIFANSSSAAIQDSGQVQGSELQYNLFFGNGTDIRDLGAGFGANMAPVNFQPIFGDPKFRDPANGNFQLTSGSAAIDAGRSEMNLNPDSEGAIVTTLIPTVNQVLNANGGIRNNNSRQPDSNNFDLSNIPNNLLTLPGYPLRGFVDQWVPTLQTDPTGIAGPATNASTYLWKPIDGERDSLGYLRVKDPNSPNVGFGSRPFFDLGAFEYRQLFPPHVTDVTATVSDPSSTTGVSTIPLYKVGGYAGTNKALQTINVTFDHLIDPNTISGSTVLLAASGGDGIFGNNNNVNDKFYNLSGKLSFDPATKTLIVNIGAAGLTLQSDAYRLFLLGSGSDVIRDPQGNALDGENTVNNDPNGAQLALPSGDGFPGGNFFDTFIINTQAPTLLPGSFSLAASTDTNVVGDKVTYINKPAFSGGIAVTSTAIQPLAGQVAIVDISTKGDGVFDRLNAGTAFTDQFGAFVVTVGTDGANTGLVTNTSALPDSPYNVGSSGKLDPASGTNTGYTWARVRIIDQSGNASNLPTDSVSSFLQNGALTGAVIDTAAPQITSFSPTPNTKLTPVNGAVKFTFTTDKNIDPLSLNGTSILVTRSGPDGVLGTPDDVNVPIDVNSISATYLANGPKGPESISFQVTGSLPNDQYQVTLKGTGTTPVTDVAGNAIAGAGTKGTDYNAVYVVSSSAASNFLYVGDSATYVTDPTATQGSRTNPYPTITAALAAAAAGDVVGVLPGVYTEAITLKPFVRVLSSSTKSVGSFFVVGDAQQTVIRAPSQALTATTPNITVTAINIPSVTGVDTELAGFSIATPLIGNPATGTIDPTSVAIYIQNSGVLIDRNFVVDSHIGIDVVTSGDNAPTPRIWTNGVIGNDWGITLNDSGNTTSLAQLTSVSNNTIAFNSFGLVALNSASSPFQAVLNNNIFWQNRDLTANHYGAGILSVTPNKLIARNNLFSNNGPNLTSNADDAINVGNGFDPNALKSTPDSLGNYVGNPAFVAPRDPRPTSDGPAIFFLDANFGLTSRSAAIDTANQANVPLTSGQTTPVDFRYQKRTVRVAGRGFPGTGPADVGAFEYVPSGGTVVGGAFRVATSSLAADGSARANGAAFPAASAPTSITVTFSDSVDPKTVSPNDLVLSGGGLNPSNPARATSLDWVDDHTVKFNLTGGYNTSGVIAVAIPAGAVKSATNKANLGFADAYQVTKAVAVSPTPVPITPAPAPAPTPATPPKRIRRTTKVRSRLV